MSWHFKTLHLLTKGSSLAWAALQTVVAIEFALVTQCINLIIVVQERVYMYRLLAVFVAKTADVLWRQDRSGREIVANFTRDGFESSIRIVGCVLHFWSQQKTKRLQVFNIERVQFHNNYYILDCRILRAGEIGKNNLTVTFPFQIFHPQRKQRSWVSTQCFLRLYRETRRLGNTGSMLFYVGNVCRLLRLAIKLISILLG